MSTPKPNLDAFSDRPDLVFVIDRFNAIEDDLTSVLTSAIGPPKDREDFVRTILFNNAIVPFSSKVKLFLHLKAVNDWPKIDAGNFHRLMHIRNQFAHCNGHPHIGICNSSVEGVKSRVTVTLMLESVSNAGQIVAVPSEVALQEFTEIYAGLREYLMGISKKLRSQIQLPSPSLPQ